MQHPVCDENKMLSWTPGENGKKRETETEKSGVDMQTNGGGGGESNVSSPFPAHLPLSSQLCSQTHLSGTFS